MLVCDLLGKVDRRSLSLTCHALFSLVHKRAPFRELYFHFRRRWHYLNVRRHSESLSSASAIHWSFRGKSKSQRRSTDLLSISAASFRTILSVLSVSSSLHTLGLTRLKVEPAHQILILSIKTLRTLELVNSSFAPTSMVMPCSSIKTLLLEGWSPVPIPLLGSSLEVLRLKLWRIHTYEMLASTPLPRLTFLENLFILKVPTQDYLVSFRNIRTLILSSLGSDPVPPTALPHLTYLSAPHDVGKALLPGRPVHTYRVQYIYRWILGAPIENPLVELAPCAQHVKELHLWLMASPWELLGFLALHFPNIVRLYLRVDELHRLDDGESPQSHVEVHHSLREFDRILRGQGTADPSQELQEGAYEVDGGLPSA